jgi:hypothetical protein
MEVDTHTFFISRVYVAYIERQEAAIYMKYTADMDVMKKSASSPTLLRIEPRSSSQYFIICLDKYNQEKIFKLNNFLTSGQQK